MTLTRKIVLLGVTNIALAGLALSVFGRIHYGLGADSLFVGPARDRILAIGAAVRLEIARGGDPEALLRGLSRRYQADVQITDPDGLWMHGSRVTVPAEVTRQMRDPSPFGPPSKGQGEDDGIGSWRRKKKKGPPREPFFFVATKHPTSYWAVLRIPLETGGEPMPAMLVLRTGTLWNSELYFNWRPWLALALALASITLLCWLPFLRRLTQAIAQMDRATERIAHGRFDARVAEQRKDELGHLGRQINRMAERLEDFVRSQKRFLGDTAHELTAPIARVQFALGILEQRVGEEQSVTALREEVQEMSELVAELLSFSKIGMEPEAAQRAPVSLAALVERAAAREGMPVLSEIDASLLALANEHYLLRAVSNLIRNAHRYAGEAGGISVRAWAEGDQVALTVEDNGPGLPPEALEQIFEPFYRPQSSRTRESGGVGLGLAIVKAGVEASGGTVSCRNREPRGLEVRILLTKAA